MQLMKSTNISLCVYSAYLLVHPWLRILPPASQPTSAHQGFADDGRSDDSGYYRNSAYFLNCGLNPNYQCPIQKMVELYHYDVTRMQCNHLKITLFNLLNFNVNFCSLVPLKMFAMKTALMWSTNSALVLSRGGCGHLRSGARSLPPCEGREKSLVSWAVLLPETSLHRPSPKRWIFGRGRQSHRHLSFSFFSLERPPSWPRCGHSCLQTETPHHLRSTRKRMKMLCK